MPPEPRPVAVARPIPDRPVDPAALTPEAADRLAAELFAVHDRIFGGTTAAEFRDHVLFPPARRTRIQAYRDATGRCVGYCAVHLWDRRIGGRAWRIIRAEAGLLPEMRGAGITYGFGIAEALRARLRMPFGGYLYYGTLVHPSSYHLMRRYFPGLYPTETNEETSPLRALALAVADSFESPAADPADPLVRDVGWITRVSRREAEFADDRRPDTLYFRRRNPGYRQGTGLAVLVRLSWPALLGALLRRMTAARPGRGQTGSSSS